MDLTPFFEPRAVAVVGATTNPTKWGYFIFHNLVAGGFDGAAYPVNPAGGTIFGREAVRSIDDLPHGEVDLAMVAIPPAAVPDAIEALGARGVRAAYVVTGGYSETGPEGARAEADLVAAAARAGVLLAGPNGQGILSVPVRLCLQMAFARPHRGGLSMITQSGNIGATLMHKAERSGVGFCRLVSVGNSASLGIEEFLAYFSGDPETAAIALYVEGLRDGSRFAEVLGAAAARKPVVLLKGGRTPGGSAAALSHTGALAGRADVFGHIAERLGATVVRSLDELFDVSAAFAAMPPVSGRRVGVVTVGGGWGVVAADTIQEEGLVLPDLPPFLVADLDGVLPPRWSRRNPIDLAGEIGPGTMYRCVQAVVDSGAFDAVVHLGGGLVGLAGAMIRSSPLYPAQALDLVADEAARRDQRLGESLASLAGDRRCPLVFASDAATSPDAAANPGLTALRARGMPVYPSPERAVRALAALARRAERSARKRRAFPRPPDAAAVAAAAREIEEAAAGGRDRLAEHEAAALLEACGVRFARRETADGPEAAVEAAGRIGWPVVLKGAGAALAHKSDADLVRVGLADDEAVRDAAAEILAAPGVERLLVAERVVGRREILAGLLRDPVLGPVGAIGLGGVLAEGLRDVAFVPPRSSVADVRDAIERLRSRDVFGEFRGERPVDVGALVAVLECMRALAEAAPCIEAIDLNPLVVRPDGVPVAVDALITLRGAAS